MHEFDDVEAILGADLPLDLGHSDWHTIDQQAIDQFAEATGDHQWIHVDRERAAEGPFGTTIAHGFMTLSLLPMLVGQVYDVRSRGMTVNVGTDKVRFLTPVPVEGRVRAAVRLISAEDKGGPARCTFGVTIELEGSERPAAVVESVLQLYPAP